MNKEKKDRPSIEAPKQSSIQISTRRVTVRKHAIPIRSAWDGE